MTPAQYWSGPVSVGVYAEGSTPQMMWQGLHGETVPAVDLNGPCTTTDVGCPPPNWAPPPNVPLAYQDNADDMIAEASNTIAQNFSNPYAGPSDADYPWQIARMFDPAFDTHRFNFAIDPNRRSAVLDLRAIGATDRQIAGYALAALHADPAGGAGVTFNWARAYAGVLNQAVHDFPNAVHQLAAQYVTQQNFDNGQAWANSVAKQQSEFDNTPFDHFMSGVAPFLIVAAFAAVAVAGAVAAGAATQTGTAAATTGATEAGTVATTATGTGIDAATAQAIGAGWESAAATSSLQDAALAAAGGDASAAASLTAAVGADTANAMIASASSILSGTATAGVATGTAVQAAAPASGAASSGESAASLLTQAKGAMGVASTIESAVGYGQKLIAMVTGQHPAMQPIAPRPLPAPGQAGLALPGGIAKNFPLLLGGAALLAVVVKRKGKRTIH